MPGKIRDLIRASTGEGFGQDRKTVESRRVPKKWCMILSSDEEDMIKTTPSASNSDMLQ